MDDVPPPARSELVSRLFDQVLGLDPGARAGFLQQACPDDEDVRREVEELLEAHTESESQAGFLDPVLDAAPELAEALHDEALRESLREGQLGPYRLVECLGEGGMGEVWKAEQEDPVRRTVAVKVIKAGMDTAEVIARFNVERQALAMMDHPNIAKVYEAGQTERRRPYFAMEMVDGVPITTYCDQHCMPLRERLALFVQVCRGVQHAHQKGIVHRDIKPSNVLVVEHDGAPVPKLIDFGIARAIDRPAVEKTIFTQCGQFVGTPGYMSPEQAAGRVGQVDTRTDVYALGVLLYELLTGLIPLDTRELLAAGHARMMRIIEEREPARPSTRLTRTPPDLESLARCRRVTPATRLAKTLKGDLDWIVMRALEKDPERRYATAEALIRDIGRYLSEQPVEAGPPSLIYQLTKFIRRNRLPAFTVLAIGMTLVAATLTSTWLAWRADKAEARERSAKRAALASERARTRQLATATALRAQAIADAGDPAQALLWFAEAARLADEAQDGVREGLEPHRMQFNNVLSSVPRIRWTLFDVPRHHRTVFQSDGEQIVSIVDADAKLRIRQASDGRIVDETTHGALRLRVGRSGRFIAAQKAGVPGTILLYDGGDLSETPLEFNAPAAVADFDLSADEALLATAHADGSVIVWETSTGEVRTSLEAGAPGADDPKLSCRFSPTGRRLALLSGSDGPDGTAFTCIDLETNDPLIHATGPELPKVRDQRVPMFSPGGRFLGLERPERPPLIWDLEDRKRLDTGALPRSDSRMFLGDREVTLALAGESAMWTYQLADTPLFEASVRIPGRLLPDRAHPMAAAAGGHRIAITRRGAGALLLVDPIRRHQAVMLSSRSPLRSLDWSSDGRRLACFTGGQDDGILQLLEGGLGRQPDVILAHPVSWQVDRSQWTGFTSDGAGVVGMSAIQPTVWDTRSGKIMGTLPQENVSCMTISPDGRMLAAGDQQGEVRLYRTSDLKELQRITGLSEAVVMRLNFSPSGRHLAVWNYNDAFSIWNTADRQKLFESRATSTDTHFIFSVDEAWCLGAYADPADPTGGPEIHAIHLTDGTDRVLKGLLPKLGYPGIHAHFSFDGRYLIGGGRVYQWGDKGVPTLLRRFGVPADHDFPPAAPAHRHHLVASHPAGGPVTIRDYQTGELVRPTIATEATRSAFSPDDRWLATIDIDDAVRVWEVETAQLVAGPLRSDPSKVVEIRFHPTRDQLLVCRASRMLTLWNFSSEQVDGASLDDLRTVAELLSQRRIDEHGHVETLTTGELRSRWTGMSPTVESLVTERSGATSGRNKK